MEAIGELLEPFTTQLYSWRVPIAIASVGLVIVLAIVGMRRGWIDVARRHPGRTAVAAAVALAVALPIGWYMVSPVFIRTSLVEELPPAAVAADPAPTQAADPVERPSPAVAPSATPGPTATPLSTPTPFVPATLASGEFVGTDDFHFGRGTAAIIEVAPGEYHLRLEDFSVRNGPDLFVYLSPDRNGYDDDALELGRLKATDGSFGYDLPAGVDPSRFRSAIIWCKQFAHLFAFATFER
jgi:hypothetical protein